MNFLLNEIGSPFFPIGSKNPNFGNTTALSGVGCRNLFIKSLDFCEDLRIVDFANCLIFPRDFSNKFDFDDGDIFISYSKARRWIFIYDVAMEIGVIFHHDRNIEFSEIDNSPNEKNVVLSNIKSLIDDFPFHYNVELINMWIDIVDC